MRPNELRKRLTECPRGHEGWKAFEDVCIDVLRFLFVPPLQEPKIQARTLHNTQRRDAIFPNRIVDTENNWGYIKYELGARMILFEFKNYDTERIGSAETNQTSEYLMPVFGRLAIICCNKEPHKSALQRRNTIFSTQKKIILFLTKEHLLEMITIKERGEDPSDLILDMIENFYVQHE